MADDVDRAQQLTDDMVAQALQRHASQRTTLPGLTHCEVADCGEPISDVRRGNGARLCLECQQAFEAQRAHFRAWGR